MKISKNEKSLIMAKKFFNKNNVIYFDEHYYLYNEGIWRMESDENTEGWIMEEYIKQHAEPPTPMQVRDIAKFISMYTFSEYRKQIKYFNDEIRDNTINIKSGILNLDTLEIKPYTKKSFCFYKLPFDYIPDPYCPVMIDFISSSMGFDKDISNSLDEDRDEYFKVVYFIQEWLGYSMLANYKLEKSLLMVGEGANGKSVLQDIWQHIIGRYNCSFVDLKYINDGSQVFMTRNKLVNFSKDLENNQQLDTGIVKSFVSGQIVNCNEKFKAQTEMSAVAKIVIACNELPYIKNPSNSVKRRFHILPFNIVFSEDQQDKHLLEKLIKEDEHIFSWAVNGLKRLKKRGYFDVPTRCKYSMRSYIKENDTIELWLEDYEIHHDRYKTEMVKAYNSYKVYCYESGMKAYGKSKFYKRLELKGYKKHRTGGKNYFLNMFVE